MSLEQMSREEFVRRLKKASIQKDTRYSFFLGAGSSRTSGIPTAGELVKNVWLPELHALQAPDKDGAPVNGAQR